MSAAGGHKGSGSDAGPARRHLLIAGINYLPESAGIAPYTAAVAEHLVDRGWLVSVLAGPPSYPQWRVYPEYRGRWRTVEMRGGVTVYRLRHYVPERPSALGRGLYEGSFLAHGLCALTLPRPDVVLGVVPALAGGILARLLAKRYGAPYGLLFQDLPGPAAVQSGTSGGGRVAGLVRRAEAWTAREAAAVAAVAEGFLPYLRTLGVPDERLVHLPNWSHLSPPAADRNATRRMLGWDAGQQIVLHAGNMGVKQGLEQVIAAARLAEAAGAPVRFVFMGDGNQRPWLQDLARDVARCTFLDPVPAEQLVDVLAAADVLLVSERSTVREMSLPSKLTSYFAAGRPVLAVTRADSCTAQELVRAGAGIQVPPDKPTALLDALAYLRREPDLVTRLGAAGSHYGRNHLSAAAALDRAERFVIRLAACRPAAAPSVVSRTWHGPAVWWRS